MCCCWRTLIKTCVVGINFNFSCIVDSLFFEASGSESELFLKCIYSRKIHEISGATELSLLFMDGIYPWRDEHIFSRIWVYSLDELVAWDAPRFAKKGSKEVSFTFHKARIAKSVYRNQNSAKLPERKEFRLCWEMKGKWGSQWCNIAFWCDLLVTVR